jgi:hypothetical protein
MPLPVDPAEEIKRLYFGATKATIANDVARAIALLISMESDEARERVAVYMDGLAQMRAEWAGGVKDRAPGDDRGAPRRLAREPRVVPNRRRL